MRKECSECNQSKPLVDFYSKPRKSEYPNSEAGVSHNCKECDKLARKEYKSKNKEACKLSDRKYNLSRYGLTIDDYNELFIAQKGCCKGCDTHQSAFKKNLVVDHCHTTGKVRGLLCVGCNLALGYVKDSIENLASLINYLNNSRLVENKTNIVNINFTKKAG